MAGRQLRLADTCGDVRTDPVLTAERAVLRCQAHLAQGGWTAAGAELDAHGQARSRWAAERWPWPAPPSPWPGEPARRRSARWRPWTAGTPARARRSRSPRPSRTSPPRDPDTTLRLALPVADSREADLGDRIRARLALARAALLRRDTSAARTQLVQAVDAARPEGLSQPFADAGRWVSGVLDGAAWPDIRPADGATRPRWPPWNG